MRARGPRARQQHTPSEADLISQRRPTLHAEERGSADRPALPLSARSSTLDDRTSITTGSNTRALPSSRSGAAAAACSGWGEAEGTDRFLDVRG
jgi:hypothetical protein